MIGHNLTRETCTRMAWESYFGVTVVLERLRVPAGPTVGSGPLLIDSTGLIIALWRLRLAATMSAAIPGETATIEAAVATFDAALPALKRLRDVTMHFDNYALENGQRRNTIGNPPRLIGAADLWKYRHTPKSFTWLDVTIDYDTTQTAARTLYDAIQESNNSQLEYDF